jgi:hypothetical protein
MNALFFPEAPSRKSRCATGKKSAAPSSISKNNVEQADGKVRTNYMNDEILLRKRA